MSQTPKLPSALLIYFLAAFIAALVTAAASGWIHIYDGLYCVGVTEPGCYEYREYGWPVSFYFEGHNMLGLKGFAWFLFPVNLAAHFLFWLWIMVTAYGLSKLTNKDE